MVNFGRFSVEEETAGNEARTKLILDIYQNQRQRKKREKNKREASYREKRRG